ncbi:MAG TPA: hypothetical protein VFB50_19335 [Chloroflexota bacterium]|nr:hypothetical protein [Chloroflexota bacterium]
MLIGDLQLATGRGNVLEGCRELRRALVDLLLQLRVRPPQLFSHLVELVRQLFELVTGLDFDALVERTRSNQRCASL